MIMIIISIIIIYLLVVYVRLVCTVCKMQRSASLDTTCIYLTAVLLVIAFPMCSKWLSHRAPDYSTEPILYRYG